MERNAPTLLWRLGAKSISKSRRIRDVRRLVALLACLAAVALLAFAAAWLRPEGALGALCVAAALAYSGKAQRLSALLAFVSPLFVPLINLAFAGSLAQTTTLAKWLPTNPYYQDHLGQAVGDNLRLFSTTLLNGEKWSWTFIPEGYRLVGLASLPALWLAAERRRARAYAAFLCLVGLGIYSVLDSLRGLPRSNEDWVWY